MYPNSDSSSQLLEPVSSPESHPLLSPVQSTRITFRERLARVNFLPRGLCLPSKAAVLILFWTLIVSAINATAEEGTSYTTARLRETKSKHLHFLTKNNFDILLTYLVFVLLLVLYPFAGFMADVWCGRYKAVMISLGFLLAGLATLSINSILLLLHVVRNPFNGNHNGHNSTAFFVLSSIGLLLIIPGLAGYHANIIQLGLDQLLEAPSEYLGLFVHWMEWFIEVGYTLMVPLFFLLYTCKSVFFIHQAALSLTSIFFVTLLVVVVFSCWKRRWFYSEPGHQNPYKMVFKVLNFARKYKYPLRRSAFTYCDDEEPSRIDFAKERYGGPFTTEQVEDVKTFLRVLTVLLVLGPTFFLEIPMGPIFFPYSNHTGKYTPHNKCSWTSLFKDVELFRNLATVIFFPVYIWFIYSVLRRCIPKILTRIWVGELALVIGIFSMFLIDLSGHARVYNNQHKAAACMFDRNLPNHSYYLDLPWSVNILPAMFMQAGLTLVITTSFEFISAQSPHSMKGLLIGLLYAIRGTFKFLGAISILPFSLKSIWETNYMKKHVPSITNCGFGYLLLNCTVGVVGLTLFTLAARRYRYRERDDPPYNQTTVETVWAN